MPSYDLAALQSAEYVVISASAELTDERILTAGGGISIVDGGAGNAVTISVSAAGVDHGGLAGLGDDDHAQYVLASGARAITGEQQFDDALALDAIAAPGAPAAGLGRLYHDIADAKLYWHPNGGAAVDLTAAGGVTDHGALTGLGDDDHAQYALLAGRAGGQTLVGGAAGDLVLTTSAGNEVVVNEAGIDVDFRIEGDNVTDVFKVDAGKDVAYLRGIGARVHNSANISINNNTVTALTFDSERWDTDTIHSTSSNTGRLTATTAGKYQITGHVVWATTPISGIIRVRLNGTITIGSSQVIGDYRQMSITTLWDMSATDYVELFVFQLSGGALNINFLDNASPEFMMMKVG